MSHSALRTEPDVCGSFGDIATELLEPGLAGYPWWPNGEVDGTRWPVGDVNTANWAQAARAAAAMCFDRGFAGGHFDGHPRQLAGRPGSGIL